MLKLKVTLCIALFAVLLACEEERKIFEGPYHARFTAPGLTLSEADDDVDETVSLHLAAPLQTNDVRLTFSLSGGQVGTDFVIDADDKYALSAAAGTVNVTIPKGELFALLSVRPIDNSDVSESGLKTITFTLTDASGFQVGIGEVGKRFSLVIQDDDCPFSLNALAGNYDVTVCSSVQFLLAAGCGNTWTTSLSVGTDPNTLIDANFLNIDQSITISVTPAALATSVARQFAYTNAAGLPRDVGTRDLAPGLISTCGPSFTLNFYIIDNTGANRTLCQATYVKQ